jgi:hypothetical protein
VTLCRPAYVAGGVGIESGRGHAPCLPAASDCCGGAG